MSKPKPPPAPNYVAAAQAQGQANIDAARVTNKLSNPNVVNPYGTQTVTYGANGDPDQATVTQTLSPDQQKLFDQDVRISQGMGDLAEGGIGRVGQMLGTSFDTSSLPPLYRGFSDIARTNARTDQVQTDIADPRRGVQYDVGDPRTQIQGSIDSRFDQSGDQVADALYRRQRSMLDPQYEQQESDMRVRLANQGIMPGSEAYEREINNFSRQRDFAYGDARDRSITAAGAEQSRLNEMGLSRAGLANSANAQDFAQLLSRAGFNNEANAQEFGQNTTRADFNNRAVGQMFGQELAVNDQTFNQALAGSQFNNQARQQALQEELTLRQLPLNEINALRTGAQVTVPQFQQYAGTQVTPAPIFGATQAQGQWDQGMYNANTAQAGQRMQGIVGLAAAAATAY